MRKRLTIETNTTRGNFLTDWKEYLTAKPYVTCAPSYEEWWERMEDEYDNMVEDSLDLWGLGFSVVRKNKKKKNTQVPLRRKVDEEDIVWGNRAKRKNRNKKFKEDLIAMEMDTEGVIDFSPSEDDDNYDATDYNKTIYFYRDYNNPDDWEMFENLYEFDEFCHNEGIEVSEAEVSNLLRRDISYCTIDPNARLVDKKISLISDSSYGALHWMCATFEDSLMM